MNKFFVFSMSVCLSSLLLGTPLKEVTFKGDVEMETNDKITYLTSKGSAVMLCEALTLEADETLSINMSSEDDILTIELRESAFEILGHIESNGKLILKTPSSLHLGSDAEIVSKGMEIYLGSSISEIKGHLLSKGEVISIKGEGATLYHTGEIDVSSDQAGEVYIDLAYYNDSGKIIAKSEKDTGGTVTIRALKTCIQMEKSLIDVSGTEGGLIDILSKESRLFSSGSYLSLGEKGGTIKLTGHDVALAAAKLNVTGIYQGGDIFVGGGLQGQDPSITNAENVYLSSSTILTSNSQEGESGGNIIIFSKNHTVSDALISARGGFVELSGKESLSNHTTLDLAKGNFLIDPNNITIQTSGGSFPQIPIIDPDPSGGGAFAYITVLTNGNFVLTNPTRTVSGHSEAGVAYLYNGTTLALISTLTGSHDNDHVGSGYGSGLITALRNGNFVIASSDWNSTRGAVTWGNGVTGITGVVSSSNSLVGSDTGDKIGSYITSLTNGNYVTGSYYWNSEKGAATWGNGSIGITGTISSSNSLIGSINGERLGYNITSLTNGNYVIASYNWDSGKGAATWGNGATGIVGTISDTNSLVGSNAGDYVGSAVASLTNGNYVVISLDWGSQKGAATWGDGMTGVVGAVTISNSLIGSNTGDQVGRNTQALTNGNYVIGSYQWNSNKGAATWGDGTSGVVGTISSLNSLVGSSNGDIVGYIIASLTNGNYVVASPGWNLNKGAATWGDGTLGVAGTISGSNSLVGSNSGDNIGNRGIGPLTNGNYVVLSNSWDSNKGAATWGNGATDGVRTVGAVNSSNSLVGSSGGDQVGSIMISLINGNYVIGSYQWNSGKGAATWGNGMAGIVGTIDDSNSLIGSDDGDHIGYYITYLANGNYIVGSPDWNSGKGAATWSNGSVGITGLVSSSNSLIGSNNGDQIAYDGIIPLINGSYVVLSPTWNSSIGAYTWGGESGIVGTVDEVNSIIGQGPYGSFSWIINNDVSNTFYLIFDNQIIQGFNSPVQISRNQALDYNMTILPASIADVINGGATGVIQANNDIYINEDLVIDGVGAGSLTLLAGNNIELNANIVAGDNDVLIQAGNNLIGASGTSIVADGGNITLVVDNNYPVPPLSGNGCFNIPSTTLTTGGDLKLYSSKPSLDTFPSVINGTPYVRGANTVFGVYYPEGEGGKPYTIFYKSGGQNASLERVINKYSKVHTQK